MHLLVKNIEEKENYSEKVVVVVPAPCSQSCGSNITWLMLHFTVFVDIVSILYICIR